MDVQRQSNPDDAALHLKRLSDTRWNCRASSLRRLSTEKVLHAVMATIDHVRATTTDGSIPGTAAGLLSSVASFRFLLTLQLLTPVMEAINNVSEALQSSSVDIMRGQQQISALARELQRLRDDDAVVAAVNRAEELARSLDIDADLPAERQRKLPRRLDDNAANAVNLSPMDKLKIETYYPVIDGLVAELKQRFPEELSAFSCLDPRHFMALDGEEKVRHLASRYDLDPDNVVSQWRLAHQFVEANTAVDVDVLAVYKQIPQTYSQLRCLYRVLLTLQ